MSDRTFIDTNVLVYRFDKDTPGKQARARQVLDTEGLRGKLVLSTQVLQEFYVTVTRKLARPLEETAALEATRHLMALHVVQVDVDLISSAIVLSQDHKTSLWDALIIEAARRAGCRKLLTEDLQDGWKIDGLEIVNPFRDLSTVATKSQEEGKPRQ
ncbi:MAG: PIN domain-containing protein [bacterium]|nr:PIN domain-containing protein [bacterium]